jgi:hypothetical protein
MNINYYINKVPYDVIINHIIPYTYNIQKKDFLMDIRNFHIDYRMIINVYLFDYNKLILLHDLLFFMNIYENRFIINIFKKYISFKNYSNKEIYNYIINHFELHNKINTFRKIKFLIGLMTPLQRTKFINDFIITLNY